MLIPKPTIHSPASVKKEAPGREIVQQGNPNLMPGWDLPNDPTFGLSRQDVYPSRHARSWYVRFANRFLW